MDEGIGRSPDSRSNPVASVRFLERIGVLDGVAFAVAIDANAADAISLDLTAGRFPDSTRPALDCLVATTPRGGRVLDLGTHIGTFTLAAAALGYEVVGVEASPQNAFLLRASLERNGFDRVHLVNAAVSDQPGTLEFDQGGPYGHVAAAGSAPGTVSVPALRVDDLLAERGWDRVDFVKMDIEGSEIAGLKGMRRLLSRADAPWVLTESNGHTLNFFNRVPNELKAALADYGYQNYLVEADRLYPVATNDFQPVTCIDYLAAKRPVVGLPGYRVEQPLSHDDIVDRLVRSAESPGVAERAYIARALAGASREILESERVLRALERLRQDPCEEVRTAAEKVQHTPARTGWFAGWHRGFQAVKAPFGVRRAARGVAGSNSRRG